MYELVFLPGFMCDEDMWSDARIGLTRLGNLHFPGFGEGETLEQMATHAIENVPQHFILVGFSMGGYVAREIALRYPGRVQALTLIGTSARVDTPERRRSKRGLADLTRRSTFRGLSRAAVLESLNPDHPDRDLFVERIRAMARRLGSDAFVRQLRLERGDQLHELGNIDCPALVIASREDRLRSIEESRELVDFLRNARLEIIEDCGHMIPMERPGAFVRLLGQWIDDLNKQELLK